MDIAEKRTISQIERRYLVNQRTTIYTALEELNFTWDLKEVEEFDFLWKEGHSLLDISHYMKRDINEVALLLMDRSLKGEAKPRERGIF